MYYFLTSKLLHKKTDITWHYNKIIKNKNFISLELKSCYAVMAERYRVSFKREARYSLISSLSSCLIIGLGKHKQSNINNLLLFQ